MTAIFLYYQVNTLLIHPVIIRYLRLGAATVQIPPEIQGMPVTGIGVRAFYFNQLTIVSILGHTHFVWSSFDREITIIRR